MQRTAATERRGLGGGQSGMDGGNKRRDLDYALKLTATEIPEHLQCGICAQVVKNAMLIPWDTEGRTTCEICMRVSKTCSNDVSILRNY